jgi:hypothetical protein
LNVEKWKITLYNKSTNLVASKIIKKILIIIMIKRNRDDYLILDFFCTF